MMDLTRAFERENLESGLQFLVPSQYQVDDLIVASHQVNDSHVTVYPALEHLMQAGILHGLEPLRNGGKRYENRSFGSGEIESKGLAWFNRRLTYSYFDDDADAQIGGIIVEPHAPNQQLVALRYSVDHDNDVIGELYNQILSNGANIYHLQLRDCSGVIPYDVQCVPKALCHLAPQHMEKIITISEQHRMDGGVDITNALQSMRLAGVIQAAQYNYFYTCGNAYEWFRNDASFVTREHFPLYADTLEPERVIEVATSLYLASDNWDGLLIRENVDDEGHFSAVRNSDSLNISKSLDSARLRYFANNLAASEEPYLLAIRFTK